MWSITLGAEEKLFSYINLSPLVVFAPDVDVTLQFRLTVWWAETPLQPCKTACNWTAESDQPFCFQHSIENYEDGDGIDVLVCEVSHLYYRFKIGTHWSSIAFPSYHLNTWPDKEIIVDNHYGASRLLQTQLKNVQLFTVDARVLAAKEARWGTTMGSPLGSIMTST